MQTVVTHSGSFDPDDVLAVAALQLHLGKDQMKIVRSRREKVITAADWVIDVGGKYDPKTNRFDHHQNGVPKRDNGVPYSAFGLLWREFGEGLAGSKEAADYVEHKLVQSIDAADNHVMVCHPGTADISAFEFFDVIDTLKPIWGSEETYDSQFVLAVDFARSLLCRLIRHAKVQSDMHAEIKRQYESEKEKYVLEFDRPVPRHALVKYEEVQVVVSPVPAEDVDHWMAAVVPVHPRSFQNRAVFPETWAGLADEALAEISHIKDAIFCHKERYIFVAESKEGAMKAAHRAKM